MISKLLVSVEKEDRKKIIGGLAINSVLDLNRLIPFYKNVGIDKIVVERWLLKELQERGTADELFHLLEKELPAENIFVESKDLKYSKYNRLIG